MVLAVLAVMLWGDRRRCLRRVPGVPAARADVVSWVRLLRQLHDDPAHPLPDRLRARRMRIGLGLGLRLQLHRRGNRALHLAPRRLRRMARLLELACRRPLPAADRRQLHRALVVLEVMTLDDPQGATPPAARPRSDSRFPA